MNELIRIEEKEGKKTVSARELYKALDLADGQFSRWAEKNIKYNQFSMVGVDFVGFDIMLSGNKTQDFSLSIDFAKRLSMLARTEKGEIIRNYFIECEKKLKQVFQIPQTLSGALLLASKQAKTIEDQTTLLIEQKPKVDFFDQVAQSKTAIEMRKVSAVLDMGIGRNKLFEFLRSEKILDNQNIPYRKFQDQGYFRVIEQKYTDGNGELKVNFKTVVYQKGVNFIRKKLETMETNNV